jgi:hypothetical protein
VRVLPVGRDGLDVPLAQEQEQVAVDVDLEAGLRDEEHPIAELHVAGLGADQDHHRPHAALERRGGRGRDEQAALGLALTLVGHANEDPVGGESDLPRRVDRG